MMVWSRLKADFQTNPLTRLTWGIEPKNRRRRRSAVTTLVAPTLLYVCLLGVLLAFAVRDRERLHMQMEDGVEFTRAHLMAGAGTTLIVVLFRLPLRPKKNLRREHWDDYLLAGLSPRSIIWGLCSPVLLGVSALTTLHLILHPLTSMFHIGVYYLAVPALVVGTMFSLLSCVVIDVSVSTLYQSRLLRASAVLMIGIATNPLFISIIGIIIRADFLAWASNDKAYALAEVVSWIVRGPFVFWAWRKATTSSTPTHELGRSPLS